MKISPLIWLAALLVLAFTLATSLEPRIGAMRGHGRSDNVFGLLLGDGRELMANQFFTMADVYFHSGYYPSIFDKNAEEEKDIISASHGKKESEEEEKNEDFMGKPKDWIDAFGRHFKVVKHTHLENGNEREILPWLRLAAEIDPQKVDTYTVGAFFLREHLNRPREAEAFLREGLRNNPDSAEILFELGRLYYDTWGDVNRARNVWQQGVKKYLARTSAEMKDSKIVFDELTVNLGRMEAAVGNYSDAIHWLRTAQTVSPNPPALQKQIDDLQKKLPAPH
jgi:tetratricopeptide (TPR) repeat protein